MHRGIDNLTGYRPHHLSHTVIVHIKGKDVDIARISVYLAPVALHLFLFKKKYCSLEDAHEKYFCIHDQNGENCFIIVNWIIVNDAIVTR